jgi:MFS family permease
MKNIMKERATKQYILFSTLWVMSHMVTAGIYATFLLSHGMSLFQINLINATFFLCLFICEIPTGAFADIFGRKTSFVIACIGWAISELIYARSYAVTGFLVAEIIGAIAFTCMNGALKAWYVDSLIHCGYTSPETWVFGKVKTIAQYTSIPFAVIGSYVGKYSLNFPFYIGAVIASTGALIAIFTMREEYFVHEVFSFKMGLQKMKNTARSSVRYAMTDRTVRFLLVITFIQIFSIQTLNMYWQPFFGGHGVAKEHYGWIFGGMMIAVGIGYWIASKVHTGSNERLLIVMSQVFVGLLILMVLFVSSLPLLIALFIIHEIGRGFWEPLKDSYLHKRIPSHERATIDSFCSISPHIGGAIGLITSGLIADYGGIPTAWAVSACVLILGALVVVRNGGHKEILDY